MFRWAIWSALAALVIVTTGSAVQASHRGLTLAVVMTNDKEANAIQVYDAGSHTLLQTLPTRGKGGVAGNARGIRAYNGELFAAVNNGSGTVAVFRRSGDRLVFDALVTTTSAPVSIDFSNGHMYVAGATSVDSFVIRQNSVGWMDGTAGLRLAEGGAPPIGATSQIGVVSSRQLLVTLKTDPSPGTVDVVSLTDGVVSGSPAAVPGPAGSMAPFGFSVYGDGSAIITLAHSAQVGLFRAGAFVTAVGSAGQIGPCWTTRVGKYVFVVNTGTKTISRVIGTGSQVFIDAAVAATVTTGGNPIDVDAGDGILAVIDHGAGQSHLSFFAYNRFGELAASGSAIPIAAADANGVAILAPRDDR